MIKRKSKGFYLEAIKEEENEVENEKTKETTDKDLLNLQRVRMMMMMKKDLITIVNYLEDEKKKIELIKKKKIQKYVKGIYFTFFIYTTSFVIRGIITNL